VYYAHKAAQRGRSLLSVDDSASEASFGSNPTEPNFFNIHDNLGSCMFFI
jgi:hypothetical protein